MANKKLKIAFIGWANSVHVKRWVQWFARQGHEVHLISNIYEEVPGVTVHSFLPRSAAAPAAETVGARGPFGRLISSLKFNYLSYLRYPGYIQRTKELLAEIKPDILQGFYLGFAGYLGAGTGFHPLMVFTGGADLLFFPKKFLLHRLWTGYAIKQVDFLAHPSKESHDEALRLGVSKDKTRDMHIGVDLKTFYQGKANVDLKKKLGIEGHPMVLSTRGLFDKYYNISGLIKAFALVVKEMPEARLVLKYYSAPEKEKFIILSQKMGIYDKIVWVGKGEYDEMPEYYRAADIYVSLSFTDSGPVSLLEAMACGCVPLVSDLKNLKEWVRDGWNGCLVKPSDINAAARVILDLLRDRDKRALFAERAAELIRARADQEQCFRELEKVSYDLVKMSGNEVRSR